MSHPTLLLADDHEDTGNLLRCLLQEEFDVIALVQDGIALVNAAERLSPDVIVTDISMPGLDGIAATSEILHRNPVARIVLVTVSQDPLLEQRGLDAGALGYVLKRTAGEELIPAVRSAVRGERHVSLLRSDAKAGLPS